MNSSPTGEKSMGSSERQCDDLTVIGYLNPLMQDTLNEQFGICTWEDLAAITDETAESVGEQINGVGAKRVREWRGKAQEKLSSRQVATDEEANTDDEAKSPATSEWKSYATFVVVVQARQRKDGPRKLRIEVHHRETDRRAIWPDEDKEWAGIGSTQPWDWIVAQVGEIEEALPKAKQPAPVELTSAKSPPVRVPQAQVKVTQIHAYQPAYAETPTAVGKAGDVFRGTIRASEPFALEASFELYESAALEAAKQGGTYCAQFYAYNRSTGERIHLNSTEPESLVENELSYTAKLPSATLPRGHYKLQVMVTLQEPLSALGFLEVPLLQVV